jgi:TonB-dependent SusC/RagA subfamily outer membrane receptor
MSVARSLATISLIVAGAACSTSQPRDPAAAPDAARRTSTSSDATIPGSGARDQVYSNMFEMIRARAPGVQVISTSEGNALRIRGVSSPSGMNDPLIVIDGATSGLPGAKALEQINPSDVLKIEVLKDAASTATYGMRGGSGVILITTKKK